MSKSVKPRITWADVEVGDVIRSYRQQFSVNMALLDDFVDYEVLDTNPDKSGWYVKLKSLDDGYTFDHMKGISRPNPLYEDCYRFIKNIHEEIAMSNELQQSVFDYGVLPINDAIELKASAERIKLRLKRTAEDIIEIGNELITAKEKCGHGEFEKWLSAEFDMSDRSARRFMQVAENFSGKTDTVSVFSPKALYMLSAPSMPEEVRTEVLQRAEAGEKVDTKEIDRLKKLNTTLEKKLNEQVEHNEGLSADLHEAFTEKQKLERELTETKANQNAIIEAKTAEANAKAILDAQAEIARVKGELNAAVEKQALLEKEHKKELDHKVNLELQKHKTEIDQRQHQLNQLEKYVADLQKTKAELDAEVGALKTHKEAIAEIKTALLTIKSHVLFAQETKKVPNEVLNDWSFIADALGQLKSDAEKFVDLDGVLEAEIIELVSKSGVNDDALAA